MAKEFTIADLTHPMYDRSLQEWQKWRYTYRGGMDFINVYLKKFSKRESNEAFEYRKNFFTYCPAFAKEAVDEVRNDIFRHLVTVNRTGGTPSYQRAIEGQDSGVDLLGSSMNSFLGRRIIAELLTMSRVGIFLDMPQISGITVADSLKKRPYLYPYKAEDIRTWRFDSYDAQSEFSSLLLRDYVFQYDDETGLPIGTTVRFRHLWIEDGSVWVQFYDEGGSPSFYTTLQGNTNEPIRLNIPRIPFVVLELSSSLLTEAANYQIALLNIASSDIGYVLQSNFPFYTEMYEPKASSLHLRPPGQGDGGTATDGGAAKSEEIVVGSTIGRRYAKGLDRPGFISPSPEPLKASMEKQEQLKKEIRQLVHLQVENLQPKGEVDFGSDNDYSGGLSYIGLELENAERRLATYWGMYEGSKDFPTIKYPEKYILRSDSNRQEEAANLSKISTTVPSVTFQKEATKQIATVLFENKIPKETLEKIKKEVDDAEGTTADPDILKGDVEAGICDLETASKLRGYPAGTVDKAAQDHANRLRRILKAQAAKNANDPGARGVNDLSDNATKGSKDEKVVSRDTTLDNPVSKKVRAEGEVPPSDELENTQDEESRKGPTGIQAVPYQSM